MPVAQLVPKYHSIGRCNNYVVLQSIPCSPESKIVRQILLDHPLSYALTATADILLCTYNNSGGCKNFDNPFVPPVNIETIEAFMKLAIKVSLIKHDQTKIDVLQMFHVVINRTNVDYAALLCLKFKFEGDNTLIVIQPPCYFASKDFQDSPNDEEDTRSSHKYLNDLEEEYQERALLAKSKRFFKKAKYNKVKAKLDEEEVSSNDNEMMEVKVLMALAEENDAISKEGTRNSEWVKISMRKRILGVDQLTEDPSSSGLKDLVFVKSSADDIKVTLPGVERPWLSKAEGFILPNHDTDESSVYSIHLPPLNKFYGAEPISRPTTIKPIMRSKSRFKAEALKDVTINEPSSALAKGNKSSSASKVDSAPASKLKKRKINPRNPQHAFKKCEACGSLNHTKTDHYDIEWFKRGEALQAKKAEALKSTRAESSNANRSKTPTKSKLAKLNLVIGLTSLVYSKDKPCSSCEKGKHHKASFKTKQTSSIKKCLHLFHIDLFGPLTPRSINHEKYTLVIVDEYSRYTCVYFLKKKSQAPETIMSFIKGVKNQNDIKVKQLRTDNGTKFKNSTLVNFCDEKRISQNFSSLYIPEQNGVTERNNRTLIEAARIMLLGSVFSKQYWTEVVATACYTKNRSTIMKRHLKTPYEFFCKKIPNISFLYVFGCPTYIHNHKDHLGKFGEKADDGYLLGYSLVSKAFRVFNTRRKQTEETYHITFDESPKAIKFSKPSVDNINIAESERYPPDEYLHPYEPSQSLLNTKDIQVSEHLSSLNAEETLAQNTTILSPPLLVPSMVTPAPQDRWSQDKHIKFVNIIGNSGAGILTRAMAKQLSAASAHECLFVDFLSEEEPKKVSKALKHRGWVDVIQDELNKFSRNKV
uniref:Retrovirus-related Pol polyprotein from transposon TNT 1-94 n=1 Tax=Tanacetum cinerariifolium TaxID=118510 RepID=A0A6L2K0L2_TANCI|nr:retrovirus-related Pol polyprotein from transposon TNT 1-94 [Tanacetum cinerariifolium]